MVNKWKRLGLAATVSGLCFAATETWYEMTKKVVESNSNEKPLAFVGKVQDEIQRRPAKRLLWQLVGEGDALFNGEAIRTGSSGEVRIHFSDSERFLDLEPDSLIVLQKANGEIALDLMEGSIYVNANAAAPDANAPGIVLNSAKGKVDISKATVSLSKGKDANLQMQVLEGSANMKGSNGETKKIEKGSVGRFGQNESGFDPNRLKILSPLPDKPVYLDPERPKQVLFKWDGFPVAHKVSLWIGPSRKQLKDVGSAAIPGDRQLLHNLPLGKYYWKLVGTDPANPKNIIESAVYRTEILPRYAPTVVYPLADAILFMDRSPFSVVFRWQKGAETKSVIIEIAKTPNLSQKLLTKTFGNEESFQVNNVNPGEYYWRMSAIYADDAQVFPGKIHKFTVSKKEVKAEPPAPPLAVHFTNPENQVLQYFHNKPQISLTWTAEKLDQVASWNLKIYEENTKSDDAKTINIIDTKSVTDLAKAGRYLASVAAVDKDGKVLGTSAERKFDIQPLPLLKAPKILAENGMIKATPDGKTNLKWEQVEGAVEYQITMQDPSGKGEVKKYKGTETLLQSLLPGEYQIKAVAIDQYGREGEPSLPGKIVVPEKSALRAPALKSKRIKSDDE